MECLLYHRNLDTFSSSGSCDRRYLDLRYIWIDAFCIMHDSAEDKMKELANMANIYENASITLVAASAAGADEGFLEPKTIPKIGLRIPDGHYRS